MHRLPRSIVLALVAAVDIALILLGVHLYRTSKNQVPVPPAIITAPTSPPPTAPAPPPPDRPAGQVIAATVFSEPVLSVIDDRQAWRAAGYCAADQTLVTTGDSGLSWQDLPAPAFNVVSLQATSSRSGSVITAGTACISLTRYNTDDRGQRWTKAPSVGRVWIPLSVGVYGPDGKISHPCGAAHPAPVSLASAGPAGDAVVICQRGVFRSTDSGSTWRPTGPVIAGRAAAVALTSGGNGVLVMIDAPQCSGARILLTSDAGASWSVGECLRVVTPPVDVGISDAGSGMLLTLTARYTTLDYGRNWD